MNDRIRDLRQEYSLAALDEQHTESEPLKQFMKWFQEAMDAKLPEPHAMTLSTVGADQRPSSRVVLLREATEKGFSFFTNYLSRKGHEIDMVPYVALNFFWQELERQVRIEGRIEKLSGKESDDYFKSRPRGSQIGAWSSPQSKPIESRLALEQWVKENELRFSETDVPRPAHWGGYCVIPDYVEFWQGRQSRLHDRISYQLEQGIWKRFRLAP